MIDKLCALSVYLLYVLISVYVINSVRGFLFGFLHIFAILSIVNLFDRFMIDVLRVEHTNAWIMGTVRFAVFSVILSAIMTIVMK